MMTNNKNVWDDVEHNMNIDKVVTKMPPFSFQIWVDNDILLGAYVTLGFFS